MSMNMYDEMLHKSLHTFFCFLAQYTFKLINEAEVFCLFIDKK